MQTSIPCFKNKHKIWIYSILLILAILAALLAVKNIKISPDSMQYALVSQEILSGNGIRLPVIRLLDNHIPVNGTIPWPAQSPLLSLLFATLGGVTPQNILPSQIINVISHVVISIFTFLLMKKLYDNNGIALLTGILVSLSYPMLRNANHMATESLFIALTTAALFFLILSRHSDGNRSIGNLFLASICASAAILTRFVGISLIPVFFWEAFILVNPVRKDGTLNHTLFGNKYKDLSSSPPQGAGPSNGIKNKRLKLKYVSAILAAMLPIITTGALFIRNYMHSGTIFGWNPPPFERSYLNAFTGTINMIFQQFPLGSRPVTLITICMILFILYIIVNTKARSGLSKYVHSGLDLIVIFIVTYTVLIFLSNAKSQSVFELRYVSPLVPFLFILCSIIIVFVWERVKFRGYPKLALVGIILSLGIITSGNCYKTYLRLGGFFYKQESRYNILKSPTYNWIKENYGENTIIATNRPYEFSFFGGYSTVFLPHRRFDKNYRIDNIGLILPNRMSKIGSRVLVLFEKVEEKYEGSYLTGLFNKRQDNDNFVLIREFQDAVVYHLKE